MGRIRGGVMDQGVDLGICKVDFGFFGFLDFVFCCEDHLQRIGTVMAEA